MKRILIQLDTDPLPSAFDRVVAIDAGVDELLSYGGVTPGNAEPLVHGAIFTRGPDALKNTAIFIGGSNVEAGEAVLKAVCRIFFGPMRVSVMMDSNGSNTTAAAAVKAASRHVGFEGETSVIFGGTGPVGHRAAQILAAAGSEVRIVSRQKSKGEDVARRIREVVEGARVSGAGLEEGAGPLLRGASLLIAAGAAGVQFLPAEDWRGSDDLKAAIDVNAVPPVGLEGIDPMDKGKSRGEVVCYGAIGVGGLKMKIHKAAIQRLFEANDRVLDTAAIAELATTMD